MTLRWRYYLAVVPLLLGLGAASAAVLLHLVRSEAAWGMQQRAEGVAASVAEFLPVLEAADAPRREELLTDIVTRLGVASVAVHRWPLADPAPLYAHSTGDHPPPPLPVAELPALAADGIAWRREEDRILGYALAAAEDGTPRALVAVAERDTSLTEALRSLTTELVTVAVLLFVLGCLIAEWLTRTVQRELGTLIEAAEALEAGLGAEHWQAGRIREINDLGGTLKTVGSLLADGVQRIRLGFFEAETIPTRAAVARQVQRRQVERLRSQPVPPGVAWRALGEPPPTHVLLWRGEGERWSACMGRLLDAIPGDPLEAALLAQGLGACVLGMPSDTVAASAGQALFREASLHRLDCAGGSLEVTAIGSPALGEGPEPGSGRRLHGTLEPEAMLVARMYLAQTGDRPLAQVMAELEALLGARYAGFLWAVEGRSRS